MHPTRREILRLGLGSSTLLACGATVPGFLAHSAGALADVVWGNHDAIDRSLATLGEARTLTDWFVEWAAEAPGPSAAGAPQPADPPG